MNSSRRAGTRLSAWALAIVASGVLAFVVAWAVPVRATTYSGYATGYAFANLDGSYGYEVTQGDFATHPSFCTTDPAAAWPRGAWIQYFSPGVNIYWGQSGTEYTTYGFDKNDTGEYDCSRGAYWVAIYFGRYTPAPDPLTCHCNNGDGELCYYGAHSNCADALNWGIQWVSYDHS